MDEKANKTNKTEANHPLQAGGETRKRYTKPSIQEVPLRPEEAVLGACKTALVAGPTQSTCAVPSPCSSVLS